MLALDDFDLARFQPHFPGYPVYIALGRLAHLFLRAPLEAATAVSAAASAVTTIGLWRLVRSAGSERAALIAVGLYAFAALPFVSGGAALSDTTASACAVLAFAALAEERALASGVLIALMLGTRASYFPLALSWLALTGRCGRALAGAALGGVAWAAPFAAVVGVRQGVALGRAHLAGHFTDWGGSIATRPGLGGRALAFARDLFFDGIAPSWWALVALVVIAFAGWNLRRPTARATAVALTVALPYALWVLLAQNVLEQPRHLLPLVILALVGLALVLEGRGPLAVAAVAVIAVASLPVAMARARTRPAAAELAAHVTRWYGADTVLFGGRSIRMVHQVAPGVAAYERTWLAEVDVALERPSSLPHHVLITSEVEIDPRRAARVRPGPTFCRDLVIERAQRCLGLSEYFIRGNAP
jgi:hypothetical protein